MSTQFISLGVRVEGDRVRTRGGGWALSRDLGPLPGASVTVTDAVRVHRVGAAAAAVAVTGAPLAALVGLGSKSTATAVFVFADGSTWSKPLKGNGPVRSALAEAVRFNAMASAAGQQPVTAALPR